MLLAISVLTNLLLVGAFLLYLRERDEREYRERQMWATRIQAPEMAPVLSPVPDVEDTSEGYSEEAEVLAIVKGEPR